MTATAISSEIPTPPDTSKLSQQLHVVPWVWRVCTSKTSGYITVRTIPTTIKINTNY